MVGHKHMNEMTEDPSPVRHQIIRGVKHGRVTTKTTLVTCGRQSSLEMRLD